MDIPHSSAGEEHKPVTSNSEHAQRKHACDVTSSIFFPLLAVNNVNALSRLLFDMEESAIFSNDKECRLIRHRRRQNWTNPDEMGVFLNLLEENCEELSHLKRNQVVYLKMSYKMANLGFRREPLELRKKVSNLFSKYKYVHK